ncbi:uncharacterized protein EKO05_0004720 [Ascochyta rabiei]|uniref:uncharacterized protein n=1 Tax=Didymella rabiei TaxID=5454 RepID=UPI002204512B|nr:uncharacterized protein EKO05_0004720 [Ascochyta rabiei]UPX14231.1 hypothetical protein EKO05_0004720 [Ascochyta rabiei]
MRKSMWNHLSGDGHSPQDEEVTSEQALERQQSVSEEAPKTTGICPFLRLPTELRLQIYGYTDIAGHTIEVLNLPVLQTQQGIKCYRTYSTNPISHHLVYRLEHENDIPAPTKRKRCFSVEGLFSLTSVCRQTRAETHLSVYKLNSFAFSVEYFNYGRAIHAFTHPLPEREVSSIHCLYWPLLQARVFQQSLHDARIEGSGWTCVEELRALKGLNKVVLRHKATDVEKTPDEYSEDEAKELESLFAVRSGAEYIVERQFRRTLAVRGMAKLVGSERVELVCQKTWRAAF